jgi:hypothetical protein
VKTSQAMHKCCNSPPSALLTFDASFKWYPKTMMKFINEYQMNIQQDPKNKNAVNYQNPRKPREMTKGAVRLELKMNLKLISLLSQCFAASFLKFKNMVSLKSSISLITANFFSYFLRKRQMQQAQILAATQ